MARKKQSQGNVVPEWVVTYGDLMSLLLCFFILLAAFSELKREHEYQEVVKAVREAFGYVGGSGQTTSQIDPTRNNTQSMLDMSLTGRRKDPIDESTIRNMVGKQTKVQTIREGTQFTIGGNIAFEVGSAELRQPAKVELDALAQLVTGRNNRIAVRGHAYGLDRGTDGSIDLRDISYRRAKAVGEYLVSKGVRPEVLSYEAFADTAPAEVRVYEPEEQGVNRRVQIILTEILVDEMHPDPNFSRGRAAPGVGIAGGNTGPDGG